MKVGVTHGRESQGEKCTLIAARLVTASKTERESQGGAREALNERKGHALQKKSRMKEKVMNGRESHEWERESHMREKVEIQRRSHG